MSYIPYNDTLKRKAWVRQGLVQAKSKSFWSAYTGATADSVVVQVNNESAEAGHTITFDYDGALAGKAVKGKDTAYGKGEQKKKFSNSLTVERYRLVVDNGDKFDAKEVGDLSLAEHSDSRNKLADLFIRWKDQAIFDCAQGLLGQSPTHVIDLGVTIGYDELLDIDAALKTGTGFSTGGVRSPLKPFQLANGEPVWLFVVDTFTAKMIKQSSDYKTIVINADMRGNENRALSGVIGKVGNLLVVEAGSFFGDTDSAASSFTLDKTGVEMAGLRRKDSSNLWTGQTGYSFATDQISRNLLLGQNSIQMGFGLMPDYKLQKSQDFEISSESALEVWMNLQKTRLVAETEDYAQAKVAGIDWGVIAVDVKTKDV
jgi:hypothetical protein